MKKVQEILLQFRSERQWEKYHTVKNLVLAIASEVGELAQCIRWQDDTFISEEIKAEVADVVIFCANLANTIGFDLEAAVLEKIKANRKKYPVGKDNPWENPSK